MVPGAYEHCKVVEKERLKVTFIMFFNMSTAAYHNGSAIIGLSIEIYWDKLKVNTYQYVSFTL